MTPVGWALLAAGGVATGIFVAGEFVPVDHPTLGLYLSNLAIVPAFLIGAYLFWRRPHHRVAHRLMALGASSVIALALGEVLSFLWLKAGPQPWYWTLAVGYQVAELSAVAAGIALVAVLPDGSYNGHAQRPIVYVATAQVVLLPLLLLLCQPTVDTDSFMVWAEPTIGNPVYMPSLGWLDEPAGAYYELVYVWGLVAMVLLATRYRRLRPGAQIQVRWPLRATICVAVTIMVGVLRNLELVPDWFSEAAWFVALPLFPLSIALAMLRNRLLDVDVIMRRSLVYGVLWLAIVGAYVGLFWRLGLVARDRLPIELAILVTIAATIAFQPARKRLERLADRWVFGERLSGYEALQRLGSKLETTADPAEFGSLVASTVRSALGLAWVRVSMRRARGEPLVWIASDGIAHDATTFAEAMAPLEWSGHLIGVIECGPKPEGHFDQKDLDLVRALAQHAALAMRNARLASELRDQLNVVKRQALELSESRARIVQAQDAERRRIQRDLHDGVQQHLVTVAAKLRRATRLPEPELKRFVESVAGEAEETVFALQDFSNGIYPSVLSDEGLAAALWTHVQRLPVRIELDLVDGVAGRRFDREREAALYFVALEAIVNAEKHAGAGRIWVRLGLFDGDLRLEVGDDGPGIRTEGQMRGLGLSNMKDRMAAVGGSLEIVSRPGLGTHVIALIPDDQPFTFPAATRGDRSELPTLAG